MRKELLRGPFRLDREVDKWNLKDNNSVSKQGGVAKKWTLRPSVLP